MAKNKKKIGNANEPQTPKSSVAYPVPVMIDTTLKLPCRTAVDVVQPAVVISPITIITTKASSRPKNQRTWVSR